MESPIGVSSIVSFKISFSSHDYCQHLCSATAHFTLEPLQSLFKCTVCCQLLPDHSVESAACITQVSEKSTVASYRLNICALSPNSHIETPPHPKCNAISKWSLGKLLGLNGGMRVKPPGTGLVPL